MSDKQIRADVVKTEAKIRTANRLIEMARLELKQIRDECPHSSVESWTNNDGDGQFTVNRCRVCGLQKDGPLR